VFGSSDNQFMRRMVGAWIEVFCVFCVTFAFFAFKGF